MSFYRNRYMSSGSIPQIDNDRRGGIPGNDNYTKLLLHGDGLLYDTPSNSSKFPHAILSGGTASGVLGAYVDTTQSVFGGASINMVGNTSRFLQIADHVDWYFSGDFTIDTRVRFATLHTANIANMICSQYYDANNYWMYKINFKSKVPLTVTLNAGGSGYSVNDTLTITQAGGSLGHLNVDTIGGGGAVATISVKDAAGTGYTVANGLATTVSPAGGTLCTVNITAVTNYYIIFYAVSGGIAGPSIHFPINPVIDTWYHYAVVRYGNIFSHYVGGVLQGMNQTSALAIPNIASDLIVGQMNYTSGASLDGYLDEFRISNGVARWTAAFTPPAMEYT